MICPNCGHDNDNLATNCAACGSPLPGSDQRLADKLARPEAPQAEPAPDGAPSDTGTLEYPHPDLGPEETAAEGAWDGVRSRLAGAGAGVRESLGRNRGRVVLVVLVVLAVVAGTGFALRLTQNAPNEELVAADVRGRMPNMAYAAGTWAKDESIDCTSVNVTSIEAVEEGVSWGMPQSYAIRAEALFEGDTVTVVRTVTGTYQRTDTQWVLVGDLAVESTSYTATGGVSEELVARNGSVVAQAADDGSGALAEAYAGATFEATDVSFSEGSGTCTATLHATRSEGFTNFSCEMECSFSFVDGVWELRDATASDDALDTKYEALEGTWVGTYQGSEDSQTACYGASAQSFVVTIDSVSAGGEVAGAVTALAHYHDPAEADQNSTDGDTTIESTAFTGSIDTSHDDQTGSSLNVRASVPDTADGSFSFVLGFGTEANPSGAVARATTTHSYTETFLMLIPYGTTVTYTDTYGLARS